MYLLLNGSSRGCGNKYIPEVNTWSYAPNDIAPDGGLFTDKDIFARKQVRGHCKLVKSSKGEAILEYAIINVGSLNKSDYKLYYHERMTVT